MKTHILGYNLEGTSTCKRRVAVLCTFLYLHICNTVARKLRFLIWDMAMAWRTGRRAKTLTRKHGERLLLVQIGAFVCVLWRHSRPGTPRDPALYLYASV